MSQRKYFENWRAANDFYMSVTRNEGKDVKREWESNHRFHQQKASVFRLIGKLGDRKNTNKIYKNNVAPSNEPQHILSIPEGDGGRID